MKKIATKFAKSLLALSIFGTVLSCSSDDSPSGPKVRYSVYTSTDMITSIAFKNREGEMTSVSVDNLNGEWGKTVTVQTPFAATAVASFKNETETTQTYSVSVFVNGVIADTEQGSVSPGVTTNASVSANVGE